MSKRYSKMQRKANGKIREIRDGQVVLELLLPIADILAGIPEAVEGYHRRTEKESFPYSIIREES